MTEKFNPTPEKEKTPERLLLALETSVRLSIKSIEVSGQENLNKIPEGKRVIIATTHISDYDYPVVAVTLGRYFNIALTNQSTHHSFTGEPTTNILMKLAGKENFIPIEYNKVNGKKTAAFNTDNFEPMREALESGKAVIIAAHNPTQKWQLPKGGYGAVYLSDITDDAIILPVSVNIESEEQVGMGETPLKNIIKRPTASVHIGEPMELKKIEGIEDMSVIMHKRDSGELLSPEERERFSKLRQSLKDQSDMVMKSLAQGLPEVKRGEFL